MTTCLGGGPIVLAVVLRLLAVTPVFGFEGKTAPVDRRATLPTLGQSAAFVCLVKFDLLCSVSFRSLLSLTFFLDSPVHIFNFDLLWKLGTGCNLSLIEFVGFTLFEFTTLVLVSLN